MGEDKPSNPEQDQGGGAVPKPSPAAEPKNAALNRTDSEHGPNGGNKDGQKGEQPPKSLLARLTLSEWLTFIVGLGSLAVAILGYVNALDTSVLKSAVSKISDLSAQTKRQADAQGEILAQSYRPWVYAQFVSAGDFVITDKTVSASLILRFSNEGTLPANDIESEFELMPLGDAMKQQDRICREAAIIQKLHLQNSAKQGITGVYDSIPQREAWPTNRQFSETKPISSFQNTNLYQVRQGWLAVPAIVGCIVYLGVDGTPLHHTRVLYWLRHIDKNGQRDFIEAKPQTIPAAKVVALPWTDYGNSQD